MIYAIFRQATPNPVPIESYQIVHHSIELEQCMRIHVELVGMELGVVRWERVWKGVDHIRPTAGPGPALYYNYLTEYGMKM